MDDFLKELLESRKADLGVRPPSEKKEMPTHGKYTPEQRETFRAKYPFWTEHRKRLIHQPSAPTIYRRNSKHAQGE